MNTVSVITIVKNRTSALSNLIRGLSEGSLLVGELIIVFMNESPHQLPESPFDVTVIELTDNEEIPLAKARNAGANAAKFEKLVFLDVDCIPEKNLVQQYTCAIDNEHLYSGSIRYLPKNAMEHPQLFEQLKQLSLPDPVRNNIQNLPYELFWSLNFGCSKSTFKKIGGFNEDYKGYGAEDTDFAFRARIRNIPLKTKTITAYHQYHESYDPPLNHLENIVQNANLFYQLWNKWPMDGWLTKFEQMGLISWGKVILALRRPTKEELHAAKR